MERIHFHESLSQGTSRLSSFPVRKERKEINLKEFAREDIW